MPARKEILFDYIILQALIKTLFLFKYFFQCFFRHTSLYSLFFQSFFFDFFSETHKIFNCRCLLMDEIIKVIAKTTKLMYYLIE